MIGITSYFDASGGAEHSVMIVAGYVATIGRWKRFDSEWRKVLGRKEFDVPYFHMKEFAHSVGAFKEWKGNENKRKRFINALISVISRNVQAGFACAIKDSVWYAANKAYPIAESFGVPYALCGRDCVNKTFFWGRSKRFSDGQIRSIFEAGDKGKGHLMRVIEEARKPVPIFEHGRPHETNDNLGMTPLQASDFAAWELLKVVASGKESVPLSELRVSLQKLSKAVPVSWTQYKESDFIELLRLGGIRARTV